MNNGSAGSSNTGNSTNGANSNAPKSLSQNTNPKAANPLNNALNGFNRYKKSNQKIKKKELPKRVQPTRNYVDEEEIDDVDNSELEQNEELQDNNQEQVQQPQQQSPVEQAKDKVNDLKDQAKEQAKEQVKKQIKDKIKTWIIAHLPLILGILAAIIGVMIMVFVILFIVSYFYHDQYENDVTSMINGCSSISMVSTTLARDEFIANVEANVSNPTFVKNAGKIYDIATNNNINPELVVIRASLEGYSPGAEYNNYWGLGCGNGKGKSACLKYNSFDEGVLGYINNISQYTSVEDMMGRYAYIGQYWYNPGSSSLGGCHYFPLIREYMSEEHASADEGYCSSDKTCNKDGVGQCYETTDEDQHAYQKWQVSKMVEKRETIFGIGAEECPDIDAVEDDGTLGAQVAAYAVATFDSWHYSQPLREQVGFVDCSSMVARAYEHFGINVFKYADGRSFTVSKEYDWCAANNKFISESELRPGDIAIAGSKGHVEMYIGNGNIFGAHGVGTPQNPIAEVDQVSYKPYRPGSFKYFCRVV